MLLARTELRVRPGTSPRRRSHSPGAGTGADGVQKDLSQTSPMGVIHGVSDQDSSPGEGGESGAFGHACREGEKSTSGLVVGCPSCPRHRSRFSVGGSFSP